MTDGGRMGAGTLAVLLVLGAARVGAEESVELPAGPIRERHELMESIGAHAKKIGDALKRGDKAQVPEQAEAIAKLAALAASLFPQGSTHAKSRAKPEIWAEWSDFERLLGELEGSARELAAVARTGGDAGAASQKMFGRCKACHDRFRIPEK